MEPARPSTVSSPAPLTQLKRGISTLAARQAETMQALPGCRRGHEPQTDDRDGEKTCATLLHTLLLACTLHAGQSVSIMRPLRPGCLGTETTPASVPQGKNHASRVRELETGSSTKIDGSPDAARRPG